MARPVNAEAFDKPHWLLVAKGFNWQELNIYFSARGGMVERNGGIESPNRTSLYVGTYYYRFVDLKAGPDNQQGGGWWLDLDQLTKIMAACPSRGLNLSQMARAFLAVPWEWNHADGIVQAVVAKPLDAYEGRGRPVVPGKHYTANMPVDGGGITRAIPMSSNSSFRTCDASGTKRCPIFRCGLFTNSQRVIGI